jgi:hypothetical protein
MTLDPYDLAAIRGWKMRLAKAAAPHQVVILAGQFVASLPHEDQALIASATPESLRNEQAVAEMALRLTQLEMALAWEDVAAGNIIRTIASVLIEASKRLNALAEERVLREFEPPEERRLAD